MRAAVIYVRWNPWLTLGWAKIIWLFQLKFFGTAELGEPLNELIPTRCWLSLIRKVGEMPEGHTIHRMARDHEKWFGGHTVLLSSPQGRFSVGADLLNGRRFESAYAHGKHLFYQFSGDDAQPANTIHIHLGLYGRFRKRKSPDDEPSPNCRLRMVSPIQILDLSGPTCCEVLTPSES